MSIRSGDSPEEPNAVAIAWYVEEAQRLLEDQQRRAESLRTRGAQIAGFGALFLALIGGNIATILKAADGESLNVSLFAFLAGLVLSVLAIGILIVELI